MQLPGATPGRRERAAPAAADGNGPPLTDLWGEQADYLLERYRRSGDEAILTRAVGLAEAALNATSADDDARWASRSETYAMALLSRFPVSRDRQDATMAVTTARNALSVTPADGRDWVRRLALLCLALRREAQVTGITDGLDEALELLRDVAGKDNDEAAWTLGLRSALWMARYQLSHRTADLVAATRRAQEALDLACPAARAEFAVQYAEFFI